MSRAKHWKPQHWLALGMVLSSIATQVANAHEWRDVLSPSFIGGAMGSVGAVLVAIFSPKPTTDQAIRPDRFTKEQP